MNRLRQGVFPSVLALLLLASSGGVMLEPLLRAPLARDAAIEQWLRSRLGTVHEASIERAIEAAVSTSVRSHEEGLLVFAETLIRLDEKAALRLAGLNTDSPEVLLQALEYRLERAIGDAMAPQHRLSGSSIDRMATSERGGGLALAVRSGIAELLAIATIPASRTSLRILPLRFLTSARPLGP